MSLKNKTYFVSDIHLGAPALNDNREREMLFVSWLDEIKNDAKQLFLVGDIFDYWFEYKRVVPRGFTRALGKIAELSDRGVDVHYFTGNHDVWVFDYLPNELGLTLHTSEYQTEIEGKKFFIAHGDGLDASDKGYNFLKKLFVNKFLQWMYARLHPNFTISFAHAWSKKSRLSKGVGIEMIDPEKEGLYKFAKSVLNKEHVDYFVFGHRHVLANIPLGRNSEFILLGEWIKSFSYGVFDGKKFELKKYTKQFDSAVK